MKQLFFSLNLAAALMLCAFARPASAAITVDGSLADWGVTPGAYGNPAQWTPSPGISFIQEDQDPAVYYLNPGWGGQLFDVEAMYFKREGLTAYFAMVTGFPIQGALGIAPGDFGLDLNGDGKYEYGIETTGNWGSSAQGQVYGNATWSDPTFTVSGPFALTGGTLLGTAQFAYNATNYIADGHYVYELGIPVALLGAGWDNGGNPDLEFHWTMGCGNDALDLYVGNAPHAPEPATVSLIMMGLGGAFFTGRRKKRA